ncbi:MAG TPA: SigE family RNA polymerase sigma factor [Marmoricola sp.]
MRAADREAFESFVVAARPALERSAYLLSGDWDEAEDLVQAALVKAVGAWSRIVDDPTPYVRRIIVNDHISRWRRHRGRERPRADLPDREATRPDHDLALALQAALADLAPRQRAVIVLRYYEDLTEQQTAEALGIAVGTVKSQARDGLARLRERAPALIGALETVE